MFGDLGDIFFFFFFFGLMESAFTCGYTAPLQQEIESKLDAKTIPKLEAAHGLQFLYIAMPLFRHLP
jgi:hypothetical protein